MNHPELIRWWRHSEYLIGNSPSRRLFPWRPPQRQQSGGSVGYRIEIDGHPITILEAEGDPHTIVFNGGRPHARPPCFKLTMTPSTHSAVLDDLKMPPSQHHPACFEDEHNDARHVVRAATILAQAYGIRTMEYTDNSSKHCSDGGYERIHLADFYRLLNGRTWYESVLLSAGATSVVAVNPRIAARVVPDRERAASVSWNTMRGPVAAPSLPPLLDASAPGSARQVLHYLRSLKSPQICEFIAANLDEFLSRSGMITFHGTHWRCSLPLTPLIETFRSHRSSHRLSPTGRRSTHRRSSTRSLRRSTHGGPSSG